MTQAPNLSWLTTTRTLRNGFGISAGDISDFYTFSLSATRRVVASSTIIEAFSWDTTKPNLTIVKDKNSNGRYDPGEELVPFGKSISATLGAGTYFLYVQSGTGRQTAYSVSVGPG